MSKFFKRIIQIITLLLVGLIAMATYGWLNSSIEPVKMMPDANPGLTGVFEVNNRFSNADYITQGLGRGPEAIVFDAQGNIITGLEDGRILRVDRLSQQTIEIANTNGRPLGMKFDADGKLIVADAFRGLLSIKPNGDIETLVGPEQLTFADDLDIAADGTIWLSDASAVYSYDQTLLTFIEGIPSGRLLSYSPKTKELKVHLDKLLFANGVALGPKEDYVLVNETGTARIHRLWLKGNKAGQRDLFASELPAGVDNVTFNGVDTFWVALPNLRIDGLADALMLRKILGGLPPALWLPENHFGFVLGFDLNGKVTHNFQFDTKLNPVQFSDVTSAVEYNGKLYVGSLVESKIAVLDLQTK